MKLKDLTTKMLLGLAKHAKGEQYKSIIAELATRSDY